MTDSPPFYPYPVGTKLQYRAYGEQGAWFPVWVVRLASGNTYVTTVEPTKEYTDFLGISVMPSRLIRIPFTLADFDLEDI